MSNNLVTKDTLDNLKINDNLKARLQERVESRNEELLLDILEEIAIHEREIKKLIARANAISEAGYINAEDNE